MAAPLIQLAVSLAAANEPADVVRYALVVGSNLGGPGQQPLSYADDDARNVSDVLVDLGGYEPGNVQLLLDPDPNTVLEAIASLAERVAAERESNESVVATFYYSGHSRAAALDLDGRELPLPQVREALQDLGATLTLVVLDACQSGAVSRSKGADAAADFSSNSVRGLDTEGFVVLASSSASELSQESDELQGSAFTHHLVSGLRGAADREHDGVVTLDEAYSYAYDRTVYTTAQTALGQQHPTLELDVSGHGGTVLTRPARSSARLVLPVGLATEMVLVRGDNGAVVAELHKASEEVMELALVPAPYVAIATRAGGRIERCRFVVAPDSTTTWGDGTQCTRVDGSTPSAKLAVREVGLAVELGIGSLRTGGDQFVQQLGAFGFQVGEDAGRTPLLEGSVVYQPRRHFAVVATFGNLEERAVARMVMVPATQPPSEYHWFASRLTASVRGTVPLGVGPFALYGQVGLGPTFVSHGLDSDRDWQLGVHVAGAAGLQLHLLSRLGAFVETDGFWAPALKNNLDVVHDLGGWGALTGLRVAW